MGFRRSERNASLFLFRLKRKRTVARFAWILSVAGSAYVLFPMLVVVYWVGGRPLQARSVLAAFMLQSAVVPLIKLLTKKERPGGSRMEHSFDRYSFPSGHAGRMGVLMGLYPTVAVVLFALSVSLSRVILRKHYLFDVIGGLFVGVVSAAIGHYLLKNIAY